MGVFVGLVAELDDEGGGVANHRAHLRHEIGGDLEVEGVGRGVVGGDLLPAVVNGGGVPALELQ